MSHYNYDMGTVKLAARELRLELARGCGDSGCRYESPKGGGMRTNGGCRCHERIEDALAEAEERGWRRGYDYGKRADHQDVGHPARNHATRTGSGEA